MKITADQELKELAKVFGLRGCCKKATCIHRKAVFAVNRIAFLEGEVKGLRERMKAAENCLLCAAIAPAIEVVENTFKILQGENYYADNNSKSESGS